MSVLEKLHNQNILLIVLLYPRHLCRGVYSFRLDVCPFVRSLLSVTFVEFTSKFLVKVSLSEYISLTTHQKAFIFEPWVPERVSFYTMRLLVRSFVCVFVRSLLSVTFVEFTSKFLVKVSLSEYISLTTHQKAFIFEPWVPERVSFYTMSFCPRVDAPGWG